MLSPKAHLTFRWNKHNKGGKLRSGSLMRVKELDVGTRGASRYSLTDEEIALSFSIYFTWGYPDYMREALNFLLTTRPEYAKICPHKELTYRQLREIIEVADSSQVRTVIAARPTTQPSILNFLAQSKDEAVVLRVAENPCTHVATLTKLMRHNSPHIRIAVAEHPTTPEVLLQLLATDHDVDVRHALAENTNLPKSVLEILAADENPYVSARAQRSLEMDSTPAQVVSANFRSALRRVRARR